MSSISSAQEDSNQNLAVNSGAEVDYPPFCFVDDSGTANGFSVELLRAALKSMGREVTFQTGPWSEVKSWLENGKITALPLVGRTPEREAKFDFTFPYMSIHGAIVVRSDTSNVGKLSDLKGRTVAVMKGDNAEEFLRREDRGIQIHTTTTFEEALGELSNGLHDAVVVQRLVALRLIQKAGYTNLKIVNRPIDGFRQDFCFAVKEGDRKTLALLNEGLSIIVADGTYRHLHLKWFAAFELPVKRRIIVGSGYNFPPYEFSDEQGRAQGFSVDLTRAIAKEMDLDIEIRLASWAQTVEGLENGKIDLVQCMFYSPERDLKFDFSQPYAQNHYVSVMRKGEGTPPTTLSELKGKRLVIQRGDVIYDYAVENGLKDQISLVETQEELLKSLVEGGYDCGLTIRKSTQYLIREHKWSNLVLGKRTFFSMESCFAVPHDSKALLALFSEGLQILEESGEYRRIYNKWLGIYEETPLKIAKYVAMIAGPMLLVLLAIFLWSWSLRKQVKNRTKQLKMREEQYRLLADNTLDVIWTLTLDMVFTYANPAIINLTGHLPDEWIGSRLSEHCDDRNFKMIKEIFADEKTKAPEGSGAIFEAQMFKKNGETLWVEIHGKAVFDNDGQPNSFQGVTRNISERKKAEQELLETKRILQAAMDNSQAGIAIADAPKGTLRYVNDAGLFIRGGDRKNLVNGIGIDQYVASWKILDLDGTPLNRDQVPLTRAVKFGETCSREFIIRRSEGDDRAVWANAAPILNDAGDVIAGIVVFIDITQRKQTEEKLQQRENQYNTIVENSGDCIMRYDKDHRYIFVNHRAVQLTGFQREQFLGKTHREIGFPEDLCTLMRKNIDEVFLSSEARKIEFDMELKAGLTSLELQLSPEFDSDGQVQSVIGVSRDVTERKIAQREDRLNKTRLEILHAIRDIDDPSERDICDMVLEKMVELSESKIGFLGFIVDGEETMQIHAWSSLAMEKCTIHDQPIVFPIDQAGLWGEPVRNRKPLIFNDYDAPHPAKKGYPDGHLPISRFMSVPVFDDDVIVAVAAVANKITLYDKIDLNQLSLLMSNVWELIQRRRMEEEKLMLISQLQKVQKMESIGNLAGGIAHDFNNILFPIVGMSEMLLEDLPSSSLEWENAQEIFKAGKRGSELVKQILAFSRQHEHQLAPTRLQFIMKEVLKLSRSSIPTNIEISQHLQQDCGLVMADSTQLHQIGMNLITNAYHAVQNTDGKIAVEVSEIMVNKESKDLELPSGKYVVLKVKDNGTGIKKSHLDKIFEPYFTTKEQGKGTGLGLSVVYGIVKEHSGEIRVTSEPGKGTCFQVYLPVISSLEKTKVTPDHSYLETGNERILLVDDEVPILKLEKTILERLGYKVNERSSSLEALKAFDVNPDDYDLVITDMSMPNITGDKLAKEVLRIRPDIPIIICTGFSETFNEENAKNMGIKAFLMKPVIKSDMAKMVRKVLDDAKEKG